MSVLHLGEFESEDLLVEGLRSRKIRKVEFDADETEVGCRHTGLGLGLTRIRRQFVVYFFRHRGQFAQKHDKMASFSSEHEAPAELRPEPRSGIFLRPGLC